MSRQRRCLGHRRRAAAGRAGQRAHQRAAGRPRAARSPSVGRPMSIEVAQTRPRDGFASGADSRRGHRARRPAADLRARSSRPAAAAPARPGDRPEHRRGAGRHDSASRAAQGRRHDRAHRAAGPRANGAARDARLGARSSTTSRRSGRRWREALRDEGHEVTATGSPREALRLLGERPFDLLVVDNLMPELSGLDLIREVAANATAASGRRS